MVRANRKGHGMISKHLRLTAAVITAGLMAAGCSASPSPGQSTTTAPSSEAIASPEGSASPEEQAGPGDRSDAPPSDAPSPPPTAPAVPEAARTPDREGAKAAIDHFHAAETYLIQTGDGAPFRAAFLPDCTTCEEFTEMWEGFHADGGSTGPSTSTASDPVIQRFWEHDRFSYSGAPDPAEAIIDYTHHSTSVRLTGAESAVSDLLEEHGRDREENRPSVSEDEVRTHLVFDRDADAWRVYSHSAYLYTPQSLEGFVIRQP